MRTIIAIILLFTCITVFAALRGTPFQPHDDIRLNQIETLSDTNGIDLASGEVIVGDASGNANAVALSGDATMSSAGAMSLGANTVDSSELVNGSVDEAHLAVPTADGLMSVRVARVTFDCGTDDCSVGTLAGSQTLPANAMIMKAWFRVDTQFVDGGAGTVAIHCEDANNLFTATDITGSADGTITTGSSLDTFLAATFLDVIASACVITMTIATAEQTAGIMNFYVMYVVHD